MHYAAYYGQDTTIALLVDQYKIDLNTVDNDGWNALHYAAKKGHNTTIKLLVDQYKMDLNAVDKESWNALHFAARYGQDTTITLLLEQYKMDINAVDNKGHTALYYAQQKGHDKAVQRLKPQPSTTSWLASPLHFFTGWSKLSKKEFLEGEKKKDKRIEEPEKINLPIAPHFFHALDHSGFLAL